MTAPGFRWPYGVKHIQFGPLSNTCNTSQVLCFGNCSNGPLEPGCARWLPGLKKIRFGANWKLDLRGARKSWPDSLERLRAPANFNQSLTREGVGLPRGLRVLVLGGQFNQPLVGLEWPPLLQNLVFSFSFTQSLEGVRFPDGLRIIRFLKRFNRAIDGVVWPKALETLKFGDEFNQALVPPGPDRGDPLGRKHTLPAGLKHLELGALFNQPLSGSELPDGLEVLWIGRRFGFASSFNQPLVGLEWPPLLQKLVLSFSFTQSLEGVRFPDGLRIIRFLKRFNRAIDGVVWPKALETLKFGDDFNQALDPPGPDRGDPLGRKHTLPADLKHLELGALFNQPLSGSELPDGLEVLWIGRRFGFASSVRWPSGLKRVHFRCAWGGDRLAGDVLAGNPLPIRFPPKLESLVVGHSFNLPLTAVALPPTLKVLYLGDAFDHPIGREGGDVSLRPDGLEELQLGVSFNRSIGNIRLLGCLKILNMAFSSKFDEGLAGVAWPPGLRRLKAGEVLQPTHGGRNLP